MGNASFPDTTKLTMSSRLMSSSSPLADEIREFSVRDNCFVKATMPSLRDSIKLQTFTLGNEVFRESETGIEFDGAPAQRA